MNGIVSKGNVDSIKCWKHNYYFFSTESHQQLVFFNTNREWSNHFMAFRLRKSFIHGFNREFETRDCFFFIYFKLQLCIMKFIIFSVKHFLNGEMIQYLFVLIIISNECIKKKLEFSRGNKRWSKWTTIYSIGFLEISWNMKIKLWNLPSLTMLQFPPRQPAASVFP